MLDSDSNESPVLSRASVTDAQEYFDGEGKLLRKHYSFVFDELFKEAKRQNLDISFIDPDAPLEVRRAAIKANQWEIGASYLRCSTKMQDSYPGQAVQSIAKGLRNNIIILPELVAGDKAKTGKKINRPGLNTLKDWIRAKNISSITFFSANRCARTFYKGLQYIKEEVDEYNVRALTIAEDLDTSKPNWGMVMAMNLVLAEMQAKALPTFVRMGHKSHFEAGFRIGATQVGYRPIDVVGAGSTKKGKPKATLEVVPEVRDLINKHFKMIAAGTPVAEGCRLWNAEISGWPEEIRQYAIDGRAKSGTMRPEAYRRMLSRKDYIAEFAYGRKRNRWLEGKEQIIQEDAPEQEVVWQHREHLRIVSDELFLQVQTRLAEEPRGKHGPRLDKEPPLSSSLIGLFQCAECGHGFYSYGALYMHCPASTRGECGAWGTVDRERAVGMVIAALRDQILACSELTTEIIEQSRKLDAVVDNDDHAERLATLQKAVRRQNQLLMNIAECYAETGMDAEAKQRQKEVTREKMRLEAELAMLAAKGDKKRRPITKEQVVNLLKDFDAILANAGAGELGSEAKQRAVALIRLLTGGKITVSFTRLEGRRRGFGIGHFTPRPLAALAAEGGLAREVVIPTREIRLEFRELPRYARIADEVYRLHADGMSMTEIGKRFNCKSGNAWEAYAFWHTSRGLEVPIKRPGVKKKTK